MFLSRLFNNVRSTNINSLTNAFKNVAISTSAVCQSKSLQNIQEPAGVIKVVNKQIQSEETGRLFAVVHLCGKQFKITAGDIILVDGYWPPTIGDRIRLDKVLLAGGKDFTLVGSPMLQKGLVDIQATIIEKTLTHTKTHFKKKRRKQYKRINFYRLPNTMIRINSIDVVKNINNAADTSANDEVERIF